MFRLATENERGTSFITAEMGRNACASNLPGSDFSNYRILIASCNPPRLESHRLSEVPSLTCKTDRQGHVSSSPSGPAQGRAQIPEC